MKINIHIEDYNYHLPEDRIAKYPLAERDASKLLVYKDKKVGERIFRDLPTLLPDKALMVFNDTKVVPARLHFCKESGAHIEIFCLEPLDPVEYNTAFASRERCVWKCVIGNAKRWKAGPVYLINPEKDARIAEMDLRAELLERDGQTGKVAFSWANGAPFSEVLECCGTVPIPPYLNRDTEELDKTRYQTLYAHIRGSVAAPTAGLHFTEAVLDAIRAKGIDTRNVCLHVGAGTFLPVKTSDVGEHPMHREQRNPCFKKSSKADGRSLPSVPRRCGPWNPFIMRACTASKKGNPAISDSGNLTTVNTRILRRMPSRLWWTIWIARDGIP